MIHITSIYYRKTISLLLMHRSFLHSLLELMDFTLAEYTLFAALYLGGFM